MESSTGDKSWLDKRTRTEKSFMVACGIMALIIVLLIISLTCPQSGSCGSQAQELCLTPDCVQTASSILESIDRNVDPCHDFYRFACGNTINKIVIPSDRVRVDRFDGINDKIKEQLHTILEKPIEKGEIKPITMVKNYFQSCMNEDFIEQQGTQYLLELYEKLGGWPVLKEDAWNEEKFEWTKLMHDFRRLGFSNDIFIELTVDPDPLNSTVHIVELDQAVFGLGREDLIQRTHTKPYLKLMVDVAEHLGANRSRAEKELEESLEFQIKLANISLPSEERRNLTKLVTHMTIKELQTKFPNTPWLELINNYLLADVPLTDNDVVLVVVPTYFVAFDKLLKETPKRVLANYGVWRATQEIISQLPKNVYQHFQNALKTIAGQADRGERWKECTDGTFTNLPLLVSSLYVRKYFDNDTKNQALEMVGYLKSTFKDMLTKLDWMDEDTRRKALEKADKMADVIGYPNELVDDKLLENHYNKLETYPDQYLKSYLNIKFHEKSFKYNKLRKPVNKADWTTLGKVATAGASYRPLDNTIFFPAGILQGVFFNKNRSRYVNYGAIGTIIGHEITHGFDDKGRQLDGIGNLINWWNPTTEQAFLNKTRCIIYQYGNYTVPEIDANINGIKTQGENIADNGGLKEGYLAYNNWVKKNKEEPRLPGLEEFSPHQLFWISAAMNWCAKSKPENLRSSVTYDSHSPSEFRVLGPFSNSEQFAQDFKCASGSRMNPVNKCAVW